MSERLLTTMPMPHPYDIWCNKSKVLVGTGIPQRSKINKIRYLYSPVNLSKLRLTVSYKNH